MKKIILRLCIVLFSVCFTAAHAQREIEAPGDDEYIDEGYPGDDFDGDPKAGGDAPCRTCENIPNIRFQFNSNSLFTSALQNEANIRRAAKEGARRWYSEQTGIIERVLEAKYNKSFSSFNTAKDHAFLEYERAGIRLHSLPIYNSNLRLRDQRSSKRRVHLKAFKALRVRETEIAQNIHNTYYPYLEVNGVSINTLKNITDIRREYNKLLPVFKENKWKEFENNHIAKILGTPFSNEVIKIRNDRYNSLDYWDRLDFMQFLIHFEEFKRLSRPPYALAGDAARVFNKYTSRAEDIVTDKLVTDYINRNKNSELSLFHPDYWKVILKRDFGNLGFKSHDARLRHQSLMNAEIERLSNSPINMNRSIDNLIKELSIRDKYKVQWLNDHPTKATTFLSKINEAIKKDNQGEFGNTVGGDLNLVGSRWHYGLAQLAIDSEIEKGLAAASLIYEAGIIDVNQKKWLYENGTKLSDLIKFGEQNNYSNEAQIFIKKAIDAIKNGFGVDFDDKIINELTGKAKCIYDKLTESSTNFKEMIQKFDSDFSVSHLRLGINNSLTTNNYGITSTPENFSTTIEFSNTQLSTISDLGSAVAFVHELIHAEIYRKMLSAAQKGDLDPNNMTRQEQINYVNSLKNNFPGIYDYYIKRWRPTWNHNLMAQHYVSVIADAIQQFDKSSLPRQVYEDISWAGLRIIENPQTNGTEISIAWNNLNSSEKSRITSNLNTYYINGKQDCN